MNHYQLPFCVALISISTPVKAMTVLAPREDVMTSGFFQGTNTVRGYAGDIRPTFRVSNDGPFDTLGAETIYLDFDPTGFSNFTDPVASAVLTVTSADGGFNANASAEAPFLVSAHGVTANPFSSIIDDTNPDGSLDWLTFFNSNILPADPASSTLINSFGAITFDVTSLVNSWIAGDNSNFSIALTGKNDTSENDFLHGFSNNTEAPGSSFLTVTAVPEPSTALLSILGLTIAMGRRRRANA